MPYTQVTYQCPRQGKGRSSHDDIVITTPRQYIDRPLNNRGRTAAHKLAQYMFKEGLIAALAIFEFNKFWSELDPTCVTFVRFVTPNGL